ncbi:tyrosine-protein phosphatase [Flavobacterium silvaticum]|uniref:protein-tyrosine-phosphatase n=1 Tax=Flavobacterium silvaticum TaxID=1852020 RepID=A0A972FPK3_9FLAO|nr:CpsB/CapC family capsule biosynthesis tyrosine phosphatase [Flavobacterium silvaticum]NMH29492.1 histidinol phosphatase [Flavobacterium silvaticum]
MFGIFKSRPKLSSLIAEGQVDIHSHLLYGLDDGAKTPEDTLALAAKFLENGYTHCIATPHIMNTIWENTAQGILDRLEDTRKLFADNNITLKVKAAAEYLMDTGFLDLAKKKELLTLKDNLVLVEMSYINPPINLYEILFELQLAGYVPVLAHPERYGFLNNTMPEYEKLKNAGCFFQVNILSTMGYYGSSAMRTADLLLGNGFIDFAGSDLHHLNHAQALDSRILIKNSDALSQSLENTRQFLF